MRHARMLRFPATSLLLAALAGCDVPAHDLPDGGGPLLDEVVLAPVVPEGPRRGPIQLAIRVDHAPAGAVVTLERSAAGLFVPATLLSDEVDGSCRAVVWDSFADAPFDGAVSLRWTLVAGSAVAHAAFELDVRNAPDTDRLVVVGHPLLENEQGGVRAVNPEASAFVWSGTTAEVVGASHRFETGTGPRAIRAAPHGRAMVVVNDDGSLSIVSTPLEPRADEVATLATMRLPYGWVTDAQWSPDGRHVYVAGGLSGTPPKPPTLWRFTPSEDLATWPDPVALATLPGPPSALAVSREGRLLVACGSGGEGLSKIASFAPDGTMAAPLYDDFGPASGLAFSPDGDEALFVSSGFFGDQLARLSIGTDGSVSLVGSLLDTVRSPGGVAFHPTASPPVALVTNFEANSVTPLVLGGAAMSVGARLTGIPLAAEIDVVERGAKAGTMLVTAVTEVHDVFLAPTGVPLARGAVIDFGPGARSITTGIAIQR